MQNQTIAIDLGRGRNDSVVSSPSELNARNELHLIEEARCKSRVTYSCARCGFFETFQRHRFTFDDFLDSTVLGGTTVIRDFVVFHNYFGCFGHIAMSISCSTIVSTSIIWCDARELKQIVVDAHVRWQWAIVFAVPVDVNWLLSGCAAVDGNVLARSDSQRHRWVQSDSRQFCTQIGPN